MGFLLVVVPLKEAAAPFSEWLNCTGPLATPSSDVWPPEVPGIATATSLATVSTHRLNYVRVTSSGSGRVIAKGRWGSLATRSSSSRRSKTLN